MNTRLLSKTVGISYIIIFFAAIFANFFALESLINAPLETLQSSPMMVRLGIMAFLVTVIFDVIVAWALKLLNPHNTLNELSTYFRLIHAVIMGVAVFALVGVFNQTTSAGILELTTTFNTIWLIGLFFFGAHLLLLPHIFPIPRIIAFFLRLAGVMYMVDTSAHFLLENYAEYQSLFLTLVAIPSICGEMAFAMWLLVKGIRDETVLR
jgi:hypothetical protein